MDVEHDLRAYYARDPSGALAQAFLAGQIRAMKAWSDRGLIDREKYIDALERLVSAHEKIMSEVGFYTSTSGLVLAA